MTIISTKRQIAKVTSPARLHSILDTLAEGADGLSELLSDTAKFDAEEEFIDAAARLRALKSKIEALDAAVTTFVSNSMPVDNVLNGTVVLACRTVSTRTSLDTERVKSLLGVRLSSYQKQTPYVSITYKPKA